MLTGLSSSPWADGIISSRRHPSRGPQKVAWEGPPEPGPCRGTGPKGPKSQFFILLSKYTFIRM